MRLAKADQVIAAMGVATSTGATDSAVRALDLSFTILENILETKFELGAYVDYFDVGKNDQFRLTNRFIVEDSVVVRESLDGLPLKTPASGSIVSPDDYYVDAEQGILFLRRSVYLGRGTLLVTYEAGYDTLASPADTLDAPYWLQEASIANAVLILNVLPPTAANRNAKAVNSIPSDIMRIASHAVNGKRRPRMTVDFPCRHALNV